jgi:hypothetical protein
VLFDEVPGCQTVQRFGGEVLSHPLIADAAETLFVPVAIYNNTGGRDREVLASFGEPSWNNPVVRILGTDRRMLAPRFAGDHTAAGLARTMIAALREVKAEVPAWLEFVAADHPHEKKDRAVFSMYCFWSGEAAIGATDGVLSTRAGFLDGREVVEAVYDPSVISRERLTELARAAHATYRAGTAGAAIRASEKDTKYKLRRDTLRFVPMTETQASRVNGALSAGGDVFLLLSPSQRRLHAAIAANPHAGWVDAIGAADLREAFDRALAPVSSRAP